MATCLYNMKHGTQKSIVEARQAADACLDAFELWVLARPSPTIDLTVIRIELAILRANVDFIFEMRATNPKTALSKLVEDLVLDSFFNVHVDPLIEKPM